MTNEHTVAEKVCCALRVLWRYPCRPGTVAKARLCNCLPRRGIPSAHQHMPSSTARRRLLWNTAVLALVTLVGAVTYYSLGVVTRLKAHRSTAVASSTQRLRSLPASTPSPPPATPLSPFPPPRPAAEPCNPQEHTELWGEVVQWGTPQPTAEACCAACREYEPTVDVLQGAQCNTWVWHPNTTACWLKHQKDLSSAPNTGAHVPWTAGNYPLPHPALRSLGLAICRWDKSLT